MSQRRVAIAFVVREKFAWALPALQRIYRYTKEPFQLYFVDCGYPPELRSEIQTFLADFDNVTWIERTTYLYPNEALNLVIKRARESYLCLIQNDVLIEENFMSELLDTFVQQGCDIVWPMTYELEGGKREPHRDEYTDTRIEEQGDTFKVQQPKSPDEIENTAVRRIDHFEMHCLMFTRKAAESLAPFPRINTREHIDCAVCAYKKGLIVFANERARANYVLPPIHDFDADYFAFRWDAQLADASHREVALRHRISPMPSAMGFVLQHGKNALPEKRIRGGAVTSELDIELPSSAPD